MVICGMSVQLYLVKKSVRLKFRQILSGVAVDKGTRALQHLLLQIAAKGILPLVQRAVGEGEGLRLQIVHNQQDNTDMSTGKLLLLAIRTFTGEIQNFTRTIQQNDAVILVSVHVNDSIYFI